MSLEEFTDTELQEELERRRFIKSNKPEPVENPDFGYVESMCIDHLKRIEDDNEHQDEKEYIYEAVMETVFGENVFDYIDEIKD